MDKQDISVKSIMNTIIPFSRFQRGEAKEIFKEVKTSGTKIVIDDNAPSCILVEPKHYDEMIEALEDYALYFEAEKRNKDNNECTYSHDDICSHFGITPEDLEKAQVDIE